jgi:uncharacterized protein (DUF2062 family)
VTLITTLYTNPFTIVPLYVLAYEIGAWLSGMNNGWWCNRHFRNCIGIT